MLRQWGATIKYSRMIYWKMLTETTFAYIPVAYWFGAIGEWQCASATATATVTVTATIHVTCIVRSGLFMHPPFMDGMRCSQCVVNSIHVNLPVEAQCLELHVPSDAHRTRCLDSRNRCHCCSMLIHHTRLSPSPIVLSLCFDIALCADVCVLCVRFVWVRARFWVGVGVSELWSSWYLLIYFRCIQPTSVLNS